jgi:hypothetical protein
VVKREVGSFLRFGPSGTRGLRWCEMSVCVTRVAVRPASEHCVERMRQSPGGLQSEKVHSPWQRLCAIYLLQNRCLITMVGHRSVLFANGIPGFMFARQCLEVVPKRFTDSGGPLFTVSAIASVISILTLLPLSWNGQSRKRSCKYDTPVCLIHNQENEWELRGADKSKRTTQRNYTLC